jgi:hypothetical protein
MRSRHRLEFGLLLGLALGAWLAVARHASADPPAVDHSRLGGKGGADVMRP